MIPMYRLWLHGLCGLYGPCCRLSPEKLLNLINHSLTHSPWWLHQMETFSTLLAICAGNSLVPGEFLAQRPVMRSFDVFFDLRLNKRLSWDWWFETLSRPLWRHCNDSPSIACQWWEQRSYITWGSKHLFTHQLLICFHWCLFTHTSIHVSCQQWGLFAQRLTTINDHYSKSGNKATLLHFHF